MNRGVRAVETGAREGPGGRDPASDEAAEKDWTRSSCSSLSACAKLCFAESRAFRND